MATESQPTATTAKNPYAPNPYRSKFKAIIAEMKRKNEDPNFIRYVMDQEGYDVSLVDQELANLQSYDSGQPIQAAKPDPNAIPGNKLDQTQLTEAQSKSLLYGQRMYQSGKILDAQDEIIANKDFLGSVKQRIDESNVGGTITGQFVGEDFKKFDQAKRDFINASLRRESGAVISDQEFENATMQYFPTPGDSKEILAQKKANREVQAKGFLKSAGVTDAEINFNGETNTPTTQSNDQVTQAKAWLEANPTDPRAEKVKAKIAQLEGSTTQMNAGPNVSEQSSGAGTDFTAMGGAVGEKVGSFFGGNKIGEAIGNSIGGAMAKYGDAGKSFQDTLTKFAELKANGTIDDAQYNKLVDNLEETAKGALGYTGPSFKEVAGDVVKSGASVLGGAELKGATFLSTLARTSAVGATYGAGDAMSQDKNLKDAVIQSALSGTIAGAIPVVGKGISKTVSAAIGKNNPAEALGEILQGKTKDLKPGQRALSIVDTGAIKTYEDGVKVMNDSISQLSKHVDDELAKDTTVRKLSDLAVRAKTASGKVVRTNYVERALTHLSEAFKAAGDDVQAANFAELLNKAKTNGLTNLEVNQISRIYGSEFGKKAFGKLGEALTSVSAKLYEGTRSGLKDVARSSVSGDVAKKLDGLISDSINTRSLFEKNMEAVNRLEQRVIKRGWGDKLGRALGIAVDTTTGGVVSSFFQRLAIPSNVGNKSLNAIGIEERLVKNLKLLEKASKVNNIGELEKIIRSFNKGVMDKVKSVRPGMSIQSTETITGLNEAIKQTAKNIESAQIRGASKSVIKKLNDQYNGLVKQRGNLGSPAVGQTADLLSEAKKYSTPEEFVKAKTTVWRGGSNYHPKKVDPSEGVSFSYDRSIGQRFADMARVRGGSGPLQGFHIKPEAKILDMKDIPKKMWNSEYDMVAYAKKNGYDAIKIDKLGSYKEAELRVVNPEVVVDKYQLTDLWKQTHKKTKKNKAQLEALRKLKKK